MQYAHIDRRVVVQKHLCPFPVDYEKINIKHSTSVYL